MADITGGMANIASKSYEGTKKVASSEWMVLFIVFFAHIINVGFSLSWIGFPNIGLEGKYWFNGLNISHMVNNPKLAGMLLYTNIFLSTTFWIIVASVFVFGRGKSWEEFGSKLLMIIAFCVVAVFSGISTIFDVVSIGSNLFGTTLELILILLIRNMILTKKYDMVTANYYTIAIIFIDFYFINIVQLGFPTIAGEVNRYVFPILVLTMIVLMDASLPRNLILFGIIVSYLILFMANSPSFNTNFRNGFNADEKNAIENKPATLKDKATSLWDNFQKEKNNSMNMINANYYSGQVEQQATQKLGVFLEDVKPADSEYLVNDSAEIWAKLKVYQLKDRVDPIDISVICSAKKGNKVINGKISSNTDNEYVKTFSVNSYEEQFLTCKFPRYVLNETGSYQISFNATFNFETRGYIRAYYMEKERKKAMMMENINILRQYGVTDTTPVAKYTNGPVMIGMETTPSPIAVPLDANEFSSYIGITIDNNWKGSIKNLTYVSMALPPGLVLDSSCEYFVPVNNSFVITQNEIDKANMKGVRFPKSYKCALKLNSPNTLLGNTPLAIQSFYTVINYIYQVSEQTTISVKSRS